MNKALSLTMKVTILKGMKWKSIVLAAVIAFRSVKTQPKGNRYIQFLICFLLKTGKLKVTLILSNNKNKGVLIKKKKG